MPIRSLAEDPQMRQVYPSSLGSVGQMGELEEKVAARAKMNSPNPANSSSWRNPVGGQFCYIKNVASRLTPLEVSSHNRVIIRKPAPVTKCSLPVGKPFLPCCLIPRPGFGGQQGLDGRWAAREN